MSMKRVGILLTSPSRYLQRHYLDPFIRAMSSFGWNEGNNVEYVYPDHNLDDHLVELEQMKARAAELVNKEVDVIWLISTASALAAIHATTSTKIVGSAVSSVFTHQASRAGNFTGVINIGWELGYRRFEFLHELMPKLAKVGVLVNPSNESCRNELALIETAAAQAGVSVKAANIQKADEVTAALNELGDSGAQVVITTHLPLFQNNRTVILEEAGKLKMPVVGHRSFFALEGALMAYSSVLVEQIEQSARQVQKILQQADFMPPLERPRRFELVINRDTAAQYELEIPPRFNVRLV